MYVLENQNDQSLYIGFTTNLKQRMEDHTSGKGSRTTKIKSNWKLIYFESYRNRDDAIGREKFLKGGSGRKYLKKQLIHYFGNHTTSA